jgi:hypothetical protein
MIVRGVTILLWDAQQNVARGALHDVSSRLCRWLLHLHDLCHGEMILLTQNPRGAAIDGDGQLQAYSKLPMSFDIDEGQSTVWIRTLWGQRACECYQIMRDRTTSLVPDCR